MQFSYQPTRVTRPAFKVSLGAIKQWFSAIKTAAFEALFTEKPIEPVVTELKDDNGNRYWLVYDPKTGSNTYCMTADDLMLWMESHH